MADNNQDFKINIVTSADVSGFKQASAASEELASTTGKATEATGELTKAGDKGAEATNNLTLKNNDLEKILRVVGRISPETGAAVASIGAVGGAGVGVGIFAVEQLIRVMMDAEAQAENVKASARDAFVTMQEQAQTAEDTVRNATQAIDDFWSALNRKSAQGSVSSAFGAELQQLQSLAKVLGIDSAATEASMKNQRAAQLEESVAVLTKQLENIKAQLGGPQSKENELELEKLRADKARLAEAFKSGEGFKPTASSAYPGGILTPRILTDDVNEARRQQTYENIDKVITDQLNQREQLKKSAVERIELTQGTIDRMSGEAAGLRGDARRVTTGGVISGAGATHAANQAALESGNVDAIRQQTGRSAKITVDLVEVVKEAATSHSANLPELQKLLAQMARDNRVLMAQIQNLSRTK
jgi:hypothetical protein